MKLSQKIEDAFVKNKNSSSEIVVQYKKLVQCPETFLTDNQKFH